MHSASSGDGETTVPRSVRREKSCSISEKNLFITRQFSNFAIRSAHPYAPIARTAPFTRPRSLPFKINIEYYGE